MIVRDAERSDGVAHSPEGLEAVLHIVGKLHLTVEATTAEERGGEPELTVRRIGEGAVVESGDQQAREL